MCCSGLTKSKMHRDKNAKQGQMRARIPGDNTEESAVAKHVGNFCLNIKVTAFTSLKTHRFYLTSAVQAEAPQVLAGEAAALSPGGPAPRQLRAHRDTEAGDRECLQGAIRAALGSNQINTTAPSSLVKACCRYKTYLGSSIRTTCRAELCSRIRPRITVKLPAPCPRARIRDCFNQGAAPQCQLKNSQVQYRAHKVSAWLLPRPLFLEAAELLRGMPRSCQAQQGAGPKQRRDLFLPNTVRELQPLSSVSWRFGEGQKGRSSVTEVNSFLLGGLPAVPRAQKQSTTFKAEAFRTSLRSTHHQAPLISAVLPS